MINILLSLFSFFGDENSNDVIRDELNKSRKKAIERIESKYHASPCGQGGGRMFGIQSCMIAFNIPGPVTIEQARAILVGATEVYREELNSNKAIRPYLEEYPFPVSRTEVEFYPINPKDDHFISSFGITTSRDGKVYITYYKQNDGLAFKESYEQALEHLHGNNR